MVEIRWFRTGKTETCMVLPDGLVARLYYCPECEGRIVAQSGPTETPQWFHKVIAALACSVVGLGGYIIWLALDTRSDDHTGFILWWAAMVASALWTIRPMSNRATAPHSDDMVVCENCGKPAGVIIRPMPNN